MGGEFAIDTADYLKRNYLLQQKERKLFSNGRSALFAILLNIKSGPRRSLEILLPDYLCPSIIQTVMDAGIPFRFYHIGENLLPNLDELLEAVGENGNILLINYFGILELSLLIETIKKEKPAVNIIMDDVQNFYGFKNEQNVDSAFTSYRKWFAVPDGSQVISNRELSYPTARNQFAQYKLAGNLLKGFSPDINEELFLPLLQKGEAILEQSYHCKCSDYSRTIIPTLDVWQAGEIRKKNAQFLHQELDKLGIDHLYRTGSIPLFVPVFFKKNRDEIRNILFKHHIFTPIHWHAANEQINENNKLYQTELSLICDQRYSIDDMNYMVEILKDAYRNNQ